MTKEIQAMKFLKCSAFTLLLLSACSSGPQANSNSAATCGQLGFEPGTPAFAQCLENADIRDRVAQRSLLSSAKNMPVGMLEQQHTRPMTPLINCTTYARPIPGVPSICD